MKTLVEIPPFTLYKVEYYVFKKSFSQTRKDWLGNFKDESIFNASSYEKKWEQEFSSEAKLNIQLKKWGYTPKHLFYSHIENVLFDTLYNSYLIIRKVNDESSKYSLPKKFKRYGSKKKKTRKYYCDCFLCIGTKKSILNKKREKEHLFLNNLF